MLHECLQLVLLWSQLRSCGPAHAQSGPIQLKLSCDPSPDSILSPSNLYSCSKRLHGGCLPVPAWTCGRAEMESYEEFCLRSLVRLKGSEEFKKTCEPQWALKPHSLIRFRGRAVLSPLVRTKTHKKTIWVFFSLRTCVTCTSEPQNDRILLAHTAETLELIIDEQSVAVDQWAAPWSRSGDSCQWLVNNSSLRFVRKWPVCVCRCLLGFSSQDFNQQMRSSFMTHFSMFGSSSLPLWLLKWNPLNKTLLYLNV